MAEEHKSIVHSFFSERAKEWDKHDYHRVRANAVIKHFVDNKLSNLTVDGPIDVMEFGCGTGLGAEALLEQAGEKIKSVLGVDSSDGMIERFNEKFREEAKAEGLCVDLSDIEQLGGRRFDLVVVLMTFHHIQDYDTITRLLAESLKQGGCLYVVDLESTPNIHKFHSKKAAHGVAHNTGFSFDRMKQILSNGGLTNVSAERVYSFTKAVRDNPDSEEKHDEEFSLVGGYGYRQ